MPPRKRKDVSPKTKDVPSTDDEVDEKSKKNPEKPKSETIIDWRRIGIKFGVLAIMMFILNCVARYSASQTDTFVAVKDHVERTTKKVPCSSDYDKDKVLYPGCVPKKCGRMVMDNVVTQEEAKLLLRTAKAGLHLGGSNGGASILDIHSGALSDGDKFINVFRLMQDKNKRVFSEADFENYVVVKNKIHATIAREFGIKESLLYLTKPTFFSRMTNKRSETIHDEYWHVHVDKETYGSFQYTSLLYLSTYYEDFTGGRFTFVNPGGKNSTVEPKMGRLSLFTSGSENPHYVEKVKSGTRYAITVSFTCDPEQAIQDPSLRS